MTLWGYARCAVSVLLSVCVPCILAVDVQDFCQGDLDGARLSACVHVREVITCHYFCPYPARSHSTVSCNTDTGQWLEDTVTLCQGDNSTGVPVADRNVTETTTQQDTTTTSFKEANKDDKSWVSLPLIFGFFCFGGMVICYRLKRADNKDRNNVAIQTLGQLQRFSPEVYVPFGPDVYILPDSAEDSANFIQLPSYEAAINSRQYSPPAYTPYDRNQEACSSF